MANQPSGDFMIDWEKVARHGDIAGMIQNLNPSRAIKIWGVERVLNVIGLERTLEIVGPARIIELAWFLLGRERRRQLRQRFSEASTQWAEIERTAHPLPSYVFMDWEDVARFMDITPMIQNLPPERAIPIWGSERVLNAIDLRRIIETVGPERIIEMALSKLSPEQQQPRSRPPSD